MTPVAQLLLVVFVLHCISFHGRNGATVGRARGGINVDAAEAETTRSPTLEDGVYCWTPIEGETVAVLDYPSPTPLGVIDWIERDVGGDPAVYWIWMLDGSRIALDGSTVGMRLSRA
jgi:hypothetical protein